MMVASLLTKRVIILKNVPNIYDVDVMIKILSKTGVKIKYNKERESLSLKRKHKINTRITFDEMSKLRASYYVLGTMFSNMKSFQIKKPGGCDFENRPIDYHINLLRSFGAEVKEEENILTIERKNKKASEIRFPKKSVGATINAIFASVKTEGKTTIRNASLEPEVKNVIQLLKWMGARIEIIYQSIIITGVKRLHGAKIEVIPDRIEAGSYMLLASAVKKSQIQINKVVPSDLFEVIKTIENLGVKISIGRNYIKLEKNGALQGIKKRADAYPLFPTDLQQILVTTLTQAKSISLIKDNVYHSRYSELQELSLMNACFYQKDNAVLIFPCALKEAKLTTHDLRCGFSLIVAAACSNGITTIDRAEIIERGYSNLINKLRGIGLDVQILN